MLEQNGGQNYTEECVWWKNRIRHFNGYCHENYLMLLETTTILEDKKEDETTNVIEFAQL